MEEYKNIMKLVDSKLAEQESIIEYYRKEKEKWEEEKNELTLKVLQYEAIISDLKADNEKYINEIKRMDAVNSDLQKDNEFLKLSQEIPAMWNPGKSLCTGWNRYRIYNTCLSK